LERARRHRPGRRRAGRVGVAVLTILLLTGAASPGRGAADPSSGRVLRIRGHGFGHGRGMGQWGARAQAMAGRSWRDILTSYYTGVSFASRPLDERVRVLLETSPGIVVTSAAPFGAWTGDRQVATSDGSAPFLRARPDGSTLWVERAGSAAGPWTAVAQVTGPVQFRPGSAPLELVAADGSSVLYRGMIEARPAPDGAQAINELAMNEYLYGVVPREMPASWPQEALRAQAVAARSYAAAKKDAARAAGAPYDICASTACQAYGGLAVRSAPGAAPRTLEHPATTAAVDATGSTVMAFAGRPIFAQYSSSTGGYSAPGTAPYLKAVPDPADAASPHHTWEASVPVAEVERRWPSLGRLTQIVVTRRNGYSDWGGRVLEMRLTGTAGSVTVSGDVFRAAFPYPARADGLRSDWFDVQVWPASLAIGVVRGNTWYVRSPVADRVFSYGRAGDRVVVGDWDGNGTDTPGVVRGNTWYLSNDFDGVGEVVFSYGRAGDRVVVGDWDGNGTDTPGVVRGNTWYLSNDFDGVGEVVVAYGLPTDRPVVGTWDRRP
jgi:SpoIID/LytB domain protein